MKIKIILSIAFLISISFESFGQNFTILDQLQDSINANSKKLNISEVLEVKNIANIKIIKLISEAIKQEKSIFFNFDSLKIISVLTSDDKNLRIFSWVIPFDDGSYSYYGIVQSYNQKNKTYLTTILTDNTAKISKPMSMSLNANKWYGSRYYNLITNKYHGKKLYTLLGWKGLDYTKKAKVIEVVDIKTNGSPTFGYGIFNLDGCEYFENDKRPKRLVYIYSADASMNMNYETQTILNEVKKSKLKSTPISKGFNSQKKAVRTKPKYQKIVGEMIVVDRLLPLNENIKGMYQFYIPALNIIDALYFEKGKWKYYADIDARNKVISPERKSKIDYNLKQD
ncbi:MAG: hypothetical protein AUJ98_07680 [Bacteroidetes bacterium CG2_30_33_31]|nr:MAG: hypothetical protein AUJ98_07680 [Bacteroidetes bacterium CG2_30_33_31]